MIQPDNRRNRNKKKSSKGAVIAIVLVFLLQMAGEISSSSFARSSIITILVPVLAIAIFFAVFAFIAKCAVKAKKEEKANSREDTYCKTCSDEFVYNNRQVEYNENSAEENFIRDRQRRLRQLDDFLKNGIIDKEEYMVLRSHYDR
ncbi:MAG: hypothetical protein IJ364_02920 [Oscillospiraceae bacterium]|nr:hypothetical protein [Oscillospiraceae bacterium]